MSAEHVTKTETKMVDYLEVVKNEKAKEGKDITMQETLLGGMEVGVVDFAPRVCPDGHTPEYRIAQAARTSFGADAGNAKADLALVKYLYIHQHTSPFEMCSVTFRIKVPKFIAIQILRHRTAKFMHVNEFSQRYQTSGELTGNWDPTQVESSFRVQSKVNKQGSMDCGDEKSAEIKELMTKANGHLNEMYKVYEELIEAGCAKEIARCWLPMCEYTIMFLDFDLNNLFKFLTLRDDFHAQYETQQIARSMHRLASQFFPNTFEAYEQIRRGVSFNSMDIAHLTGEKIMKSVSGKKELAWKLKDLGMDPEQFSLKDDDEKNPMTYDSPNNDNLDNVKGIRLAVTSSSPPVEGKSSLQESLKSVNPWYIVLSALIFMFIAIGVRLAI